MIPVIVRQKATIIHNCIQQIQKTTDLKPDALDSRLIQDAFILNVQRAVQACIDLASWICRDRKYGVPDTYRKNFELLFQNQFIDEAMLKSMQSMCGFRNIAIHEYKKIKKEILQSILIRHLQDLELFYKLTIHFYETRSTD